MHIILSHYLHWLVLQLSNSSFQMLQLKLFEDFKYLPEIWWDVHDIDWKIKKPTLAYPVHLQS